MVQSVDLGHLEAVVTRLVEIGRYSSKSEVLREGIRLLYQREKRLEALDAALARGLADVEAGRVRPAKDVLDRLKARYANMANDRGDG
jgi:antitoxin ParD1/3/4